MKSERQEFSRKEDFIQWIRETLEAIRSGADRNVVLFVGYDPISWRLWASLAPQTDAPDWSYRSYPIPKTMAEARQIWDTTHEEYLCLFFQLDLYIHSIVVAVRQGVW